MAKVLGIGGIFFRSGRVEELRAWYARVLGFDVESWGGVTFPPLPAGVTVWSLFPENTAYFAPSEERVMVNFVVDDLDGLLERAAAEGVEPVGKAQDANGKFAWLIDPDGRKIELWQAV